ncbi:MAG: GntR family transcriptional regulator [Parvularculaceae bacterium]|nr:GntR family transcriptional regulator [Parvularculaceae bacterium]
MPRSETKLNLTEADIDQGSGIPLYQQVYNLLRTRIVNGELTLNQRLPAEQELTGMLGISRITAKRAMHELALAGLVRRQRGIGTVVTYDATAPVVKGQFDTLLDGLTRMGLETEVRLLDCTAGAPSPAIAEALALKADQMVQRIVRLRLLDGAPFSYLITYIPDDVAEGYEQSELASESFLSLLAKAGHAPVSAEQTISAIAAEAAVAVNLGVTPGSPLLRIHRVMRDASGRPVQDITAHYRADRFAYQMTLNKEAGAASDWTSGD